MTDKTLYEKAQARLEELNARQRKIRVIPCKEYRDIDYLIRAIVEQSSCANIGLPNVAGIRSEGFDWYYNSGSVLFSSAESFGDRANNRESYEHWNKRTKKALDDLYKCNLTGEPCVARQQDFHASDISSGDSNQMLVVLNTQLRCPAFKFRKTLGKLLEEKV